MKTDELMLIRDCRAKNQFKIDDEYINGYAKICGVYASVTYSSLCRHAEFHSQKCFPSMDLIAQEHGICRDSVKRAIKILEILRIVFVVRQKDPKTGQQLPNEYYLMDKKYWVPKEDARGAITATAIRGANSPKSRGAVKAYKDNKEEKDNKGDFIVCKEEAQEYIKKLRGSIDII